MFGKLIKLILGFIFITVAITFLPDNIKQGIAKKARSLVDLVIPDTWEKKAQKKLDPFLHTPIERRARLLDQLERNIEEIKGTLEKTGDSAERETTAPLVQKLNETETLVENLKTANTEPTIIQQATQKLISILSPATSSPPAPPPDPSCRWTCKAE